MLGRFTVRPSDDGSGTFGVWDGAVNGWRAKDVGDEAEAHRVASDLDIQFNAHGPRPSEHVWRVDPTRRVCRAVEWQTGELDVWIRDDDGQILGRFHAPDGRVIWVPGSDLRPADNTP